MYKHTIHNSLLTKPVRVALIGCGGTGSQFLSGLARIHYAMCEVGHPYGLEVTAYDPDTVSASNIGRQLFSPADIGINKAVLLIHRLNTFYGLDWEAVPAKFNGQGQYGHVSPDIIVTSTDTRRSRREIAKYLKQSGVKYWLDMGNREKDGQVILGEPFHPYYEKKKDRPMRLPTVTELYPGILDESIPEDDTPSCSLAEALERQDLFINQGVATFGLQLFWSLFRQGGLNFHGYFINLASGRVTNLPVDQEVWKRFVPKRMRLRSKKAVPVVALEKAAKAA